MVDKLSGAGGWIDRRGIKLDLVRKVYNKDTKKYYTRRYKSTAEANRSFAFGAARNIHKRGFIARGRGFWSEIVNESALTELTQMIATNYGEVFAAEIIEE